MTPVSREGQGQGGGEKSKQKGSKHGSSRSHHSVFSTLTDNQSEYSVGSEEEDEDFDERPEGGTFSFLPQLFPFHFPTSFLGLLFLYK